MRPGRTRRSVVAATESLSNLPLTPSEGPACFLAGRCGNGTRNGQAYQKSRPPSLDNVQAPIFRTRHGSERQMS